MRPLTDAALSAGLSQALDDVFAVARFAVGEQRPISPRIAEVVCIALSPDYPAADQERIDALQHMASWALNEFSWLEKKRPLTTDERNLKAIAERLYDAMDGRLAMPPEVRRAYLDWRQRRTMQ